MCWISVFIYNFYSFFRKLKKGIARWKNPCCGDMLFSYLHLFHCRKTFLVDENVDIINNLFGKNRNRKRERESENLPLPFHVDPPNWSAGDTPSPLRESSLSQERWDRQSPLSESSLSQERWHHQSLISLSFHHSSINYSTIWNTLFSLSLIRNN